MKIRAKTLTLGAIVFGAVTTVTVILAPPLRFAYRNPRLHVAIDTTDTVIALLVAFLLFGRFARSHRARDESLIYALLVLGLGNLFLAAIPTIATGARTDDVTTWGSLATRLLGATFLLRAAFTGYRKVAAHRRGWSILLTASGIVLLVGITVHLLEPILPVAVETTAPANASQPVFEGHALVIALHGVLVALFGLAAVMFTNIAERDNDELMRWFGAGAALSAFARLHYLLYPSLYTDYVYTGDIYRLGFYLMLLVGAGREIASYWRELAETAVADERRRIARDLHDGLAQELSFLWADLRALGRERPADIRVTRASAAAERALDESRRAIAAFTQSPSEPVDTVLTSYIYDVASRLGARVRLDLTPDIEMSAKLREDLLRVAREAVTNAARHGGAETITVRLWRDGALRLQIADDGVGFDPAQPTANGSFGIVSMRERVTNHGGTLDIVSQPGEGTRVEVMLP